MEKGGERMQKLKDGEKGYHVPSAGDDTATVVTHNSSYPRPLHQCPSTVSHG